MTADQRRDGCDGPARPDAPEVACDGRRRRAGAGLRPAGRAERRDNPAGLEAAVDALVDTIGVKPADPGLAVLITKPGGVLLMKAMALRPAEPGADHALDAVRDRVGVQDLYRHRCPDAPAARARLGG